MGTTTINWAGFWLLAGFMAGIAAAFFLVPLWQRQPGGKRKWLLFAAPFAFVVIAIGLYVLKGAPLSVEQPNAFPKQLMWPDSHAALQGAETTSNAGSMEEVANKLASRLSAGSGTDADWQLLQQTYEFIGDAEAVELAKQHRLKTYGASVPAEATTTNSERASNDENAKLAPYQARIAKNDRDTEAWLALAELQRSARNFAAANDAYERLIALKAMTADSWADYADAQASLTGSLSNDKTRAAVDAALKLEPKHAKALWLQASIAHEEHRYNDALALWQRLLTVIPKDSADTKIIQANLDEARALAANTPSTTKVMNRITPESRITGRIELDPSLKQRVGSDMTLFVFAKPDDGMGMPAAVLRMVIKSWPVEFALDDSQAMLPTRKLSQFKSVSVQARLSRSGQAVAQAGDFQSDAINVATQDAQPVLLHVAHIVK